MADEFCLKMPDFHVTFRDLLYAVNLRHGTNGFTSLPKEGLLRIFSPWKIRRLRPGLNPRTWVPKASTLSLDDRSRVIVGNFGCSAVDVRQVLSKSTAQSVRLGIKKKNWKRPANSETTQLLIAVWRQRSLEGVGSSPARACRPVTRNLAPRLRCLRKRACNKLNQDCSRTMKYSTVYWMLNVWF